MIDEKNFFDESVKIGMTTYNSIRKTTTGQGDDCTTRCLLDYTYLKKNMS